MDREPRPARLILDSDRTIALALGEARRMTEDRVRLTRLLVEHFAVDLDLLAAAVGRIEAPPRA